MEDLFAYSKKLIEKVSCEDLGEFNFLKNGLKIETRTLGPSEAYKYNVRSNRQIFIKSSSGMVLVIADYLSARDLLNKNEFYRAPGGGIIEFKFLSNFEGNIGESTSAELLIIETALQEGR